MLSRASLRFQVHTRLFTTEVKVHRIRERYLKKEKSSHFHHSNSFRDISVGKSERLKNCNLTENEAVFSKAADATHLLQVGLPPSNIVRSILKRRENRQTNDISKFIDGPKLKLRRRQSLYLYRKREGRPRTVRIGEAVHPADLIKKNVRGTRRYNAGQLNLLAKTLKPTLFPEQFLGQNSLNEMLKQKREKDMLTEKMTIFDQTTIYVNPICRDMDRLLLTFDTVEDVLECVISHRGVFYVQNLVTALQLISILSNYNENQNTFIELINLDHDERFSLLINDLKENRKHFDLISLINILISLNRLGITNFLVLNAFIHPITKSKLPAESHSDLTKILKVVQIYALAGYRDGVLFDHCAQSIEEGRCYLKKETLVSFCKIIGGLDSHHLAFFQSVQMWLLDPTCPFGLQRSELWTAHDVAIMIEAFTRHSRLDYDLVLHQLNNVLMNMLESDKYTPQTNGVAMSNQSMGVVLRAQYSNNFPCIESRNVLQVKDLITCLHGFRKVYLSYPHTATCIAKKVSNEVEVAVVLARELSTLSISRLCFFIDAVAHFGFKSIEVKTAVKNVLTYMEGRIDDVSERSCIRACWGIIVYDLTDEFNDLLFMLYRKIGKSNAWEHDKIRVFQLWCSQMIQFPSMDYVQTPHVLYDCFRQWLLDMGGFRTPYLVESQEVSLVLNLMNVDHVLELELNMPYTLDIAFEKKRKAILIVNQCARNDFEPAGSSVVQFLHLKYYGWEAWPLSVDYWRSLQSLEEKKRSLSYLLDRSGVTDSFVTPEKFEFHS